MNFSIQSLRQGHGKTATVVAVLMAKGLAVDIEDAEKNYYGENA